MKTLLGFVVLSFFFLSCGGYRETITQKNEKGQIKFVGNSLNVSISIDDGPLFVIDKPDVVYQVQPGKHNIKVYKNNQMIVNRDLILDSNAIMEIDIP